VRSTAFLSCTAGRCRPCLLQCTCSPDATSLRAHAQTPVVCPDLPLHSPINRGMCVACPPHRRCLPSSVNRAATIPCFSHFTAAGDSSLRPPTSLVCKSRRSSPSGRSSLCPPRHLPIIGAPLHHCGAAAVVPSSVSKRSAPYHPPFSLVARS
jgi:hypothetical protein